MANTPAALLPDVKYYLNITWEDAQTEEKLLGIIERGMRYLDRLAGAALEYSEEGQARQLLFDYCRLVRADAFDMYQKMYLHEILALQFDHMEVEDGG